MSLLKLVPELVTAIGGILLVLRDWKISDKRTRNHHHITLVILIALLLAAVSSAYVKILDEKTGRADQTERDRWVTGSSRIPIVVASTPFEEKDVYSFNVFNTDDVPCYDVKVNIQSWNDRAAEVDKRPRPRPLSGVLTKIPISADQAEIFYGQTFNIGTVAAKENRPFAIVRPKTGNTYPLGHGTIVHMFSVNIWTKNNFSMETIQFIKTSEGIVQRSHVSYTPHGSKGPGRVIRFSSDDYFDKKNWDTPPEGLEEIPAAEPKK